MRPVKVLRNIIKVTISNITAIISGIIVSFLIPKILEMNDYGYYKTFTLYTTYIGIFSLGIIDGIVLKYGGEEYENLDNKVFRSLFKWYTLIHLIFTFIIIGASLMLFYDELRYIFILLGINMIAVNFAGYFQQLSQITQRYREYSIRKILQSALNTIIIILLFYRYSRGALINYKIYLWTIVGVNIVMTLWYIYTYREKIFGYSLHLSDTSVEVIKLIKIGFPLLFANLSSVLILTMNRQFVNLLFDTEIYAVYAFAYNMLALVTVATSAVSTVLYPTFKRTNIDELKANYSRLITIVQIFVYAALIFYFPLCLFIKWFLPQYADSLIIFRIIFPGLAISSSITVVMHNYYKTLGNNIIYFKKSLIIIFLSFVANFMAFWLFETTIAITVTSIIIMIIWYIFIEQFFVESFGYSREKNLQYMLVMMILFYVITSIQNYIIGFFIYIIVFTIISLLFYKNMIKEFIPQLIHR